MIWNKSNNYIRKWYGKTLHIFDPVHGLNYYWIKAKDRYEFIRIVKNKYNLKIEDTGFNGKFITIKVNNIEVGLLWADDVVSIAHECMHAVFWVLEKRGITITHETDESACYLHSFLMRAILNI